MRFAPPKSAPPESRKFSTKDTEQETSNDLNISGWVITPVQPDLALLRECLDTAPRRCSSATERTTCGQLVVNFGRIHRSMPPEGIIKTRSRSKDSGVDGLTDSGVDNMLVSRRQDEDEFSDISESNDGSLDHEEEVEPELELLMGSEVELSEQESRDTFNESHDTFNESRDTLPLNEEEKEEEKEKKRELNTSCSLTNEPIKQTHSEPTSLQLLYSENSSRNKSRCKGRIDREHQLPHPITPDIPGSAPPKQQLWTRARKLERHSTSPSIVCSHNEPCPEYYKGKKSPDPIMTHIEHVSKLHSTRPPYRNEKRRTSHCSFNKSSCSIPSFSTPNQALLLIGMSSAKPPPPPPPPPQESNKNIPAIPERVIPPRKANIQALRGTKPTLVARARNLVVNNRNHHMLQLPELGVNGSGDLVIRKKQIISG